MEILTINQTINQNKREKTDKSARCPICKLNGNSNGALCEYHALMTNKFDWIRNYINNLDTVDKNTIYILEFAIGERKSMIISRRRKCKQVDIVHGKMQFEEYLQKKSCSVYMERIIGEIMILEKAKGKVLNIMDSSNGNSNNDGGNHGN